MIGAMVSWLAYSWGAWLLWGWFVVPLGVTPLTFGQVMGLHMLWSMLRARTTEPIEDVAVVIVAVACSAVLAALLGVL